MAFPELSARLRHLDKSAHLLTTSAPETSRYLMSQHYSLMSDSDLDLTESQKRKTCGACGTIIILGWEGKLEVDSQQPRRGKGRPKREAPAPSKAIVYTCDTCSRKTRFPLASTSRPARYKVASSNLKVLPAGKPSATPQMDSTSVTKTPSSSSNSKKRAKSRKNGGLEAILAKQKASQSASSGFGLDLMDFMKKC